MMSAMVSGWIIFQKKKPHSKIINSVNCDTGNGAMLIKIQPAMSPFIKPAADQGMVLFTKAINRAFHLPF